MPVVPVIGLLFFAAFLLIWLWQNPGVLKGPLSKAEIDRYMSLIQALPFLPEERLEMLRRVQAWMEKDDGKPVYMLNLMRFYPHLRHFPGSFDFNGAPRDSNAAYEAAVIPLLFRLGGYPVFAGKPQGRNIMTFEPELDDWSRVLVVRYPSRRTFMNLMSHPRFKEVEPLKLMALKVMLTPMRPQMTMTELPVIAAATLLPLFLAIGWWCSAHAG